MSEKRPSDIATDQDRFARIWGVVAILVSVPLIGASVWTLAIERVFNLWVVGCSAFIGVPVLVWGIKTLIGGSRPDQD